MSTYNNNRNNNMNNNNNNNNNNRTNNKGNKRNNLQNNNNNKYKSNKDICDLGINCPYKHEYQHSLEFSHDNIPIDNQQQLQQNQIPIIPFSGRGNVLGGERLKPWKKNDLNKRSIDLDKYISSSSQMSYGSNNDNNSKKQKKNIDYDDMDMIEDSPQLICDICHKSVDLHNWDKHAFSHERNHREHEIVSLVTPSSKQSSRDISDVMRTSLREEQDREYETSILTDLLKTSKIEYELSENKRKRNVIEEEEQKILKPSSFPPPTPKSNIPMIDLSDSPISRSNTTTTTLSTTTNNSSRQNNNNNNSSNNNKNNKLTLKTNNNNTTTNSFNSSSSKSFPSSSSSTITYPTNRNIQTFSVAFRLPNSLTSNESTSSSSTTTTIVGAQVIKPPAKIPNRIIHNFSSHDKVQSIFSYLTSLPYLQGKTNLELKSVIASDGLYLSQQSNSDCQKYLFEAGITPNIVVIVSDPSI